jgi:hypothetical protein
MSFYPLSEMSNKTCMINGHFSDFAFGLSRQFVAFDRVLLWRHAGQRARFNSCSKASPRPQPEESTRFVIPKFSLIHRMQVKARVVLPLDASPWRCSLVV